MTDGSRALPPSSPSLPLNPNMLTACPDRHLDKLGKRAISYIRNYCDQQEIDSSPSTVPHPSTWTPPTAGCVQINFDGGSIGGTHSGWGFAIRDHHGNLLLAGTKHTYGFTGGAVEEARACLYALRCAHNHDFSNIIIEGDNLHLIEKIKAKEGNRVAHDLTHWEPLCPEGRLWESDVSAAILDRASDDMYLYIHNNLI
ncbi:hypothetical protein Cgig2_018040 [Carnegiea gigantea]|uniref:RNase H type-1 domain-containing protein n=1 Tax=Carnegiea gigantea TaxID=171969 RepID=A0A9Q1JZ43_9CARY|nr:hypothetical protein Cgig2_018040 [Carnegiea gigantea]